MSITVLTLSGHPANFPARDVKDPRTLAIEVANYLEACAGGMIESTSLAVDAAAVAATATVTLAAVLAADTVTVCNTVFTAVNGGTPTAVQFDMSGTDTADAASFVAAVNAHTTIGRMVTASNLLGVVTLTSKVPGVFGNGLALASSNGTRLAVVAFAGGSSTARATYTFGG